MMVVIIAARRFGQIHISPAIASPHLRSGADDCIARFGRKQTRIVIGKVLGTNTFDDAVTIVTMHASALNDAADSILDAAMSPTHRGAPL